MAPVTGERVRIAREWGLQSADDAALACRAAGLPYWAACALLEKESRGRNVYGHDQGGVFSRDEHPEVDDRNFLQFLLRVVNGELSNGVGPCQVTYAGSLKDGHRDGGYFRQMAEAGLRPWVPGENMRFGFGVLAGHYARTGSWRSAGRLYNGRDSYGADLVLKCNQWRERLRIKGDPVK